MDITLFINKNLDKFKIVKDKLIKIKKQNIGFYILISKTNKYFSVLLVSNWNEKYNNEDYLLIETKVWDILKIDHYDIHFNIYMEHLNNIELDYILNDKKDFEYNTKYNDYDIGNIILI